MFVVRIPRGILLRLPPADRPDAQLPKSSHGLNVSYALEPGTTAVPARCSAPAAASARNGPKPQEFQTPAQSRSRGREREPGGPIAESATASEAKKSVTQS